MDKKIIFDEKQRLQQRGLDPNNPIILEDHLTAGELTVKLHNYKEFIEILHFFVDKFLSSVTGDPFLIAITDDKGHVLAFKGDPTIIATVNKLGIVVGARMLEENDSNSIMMCLRFKQPVQLTGEDHYYRIHHNLSCCSAPFYNEGHRRIEGTISFMTDIEFAHPHLLALLCTIADSAERELVLRRQNMQLQILNQVLLETNYYGVIITDAYGQIVEINENSLAILQGENWNKENYMYSSVYQLGTIGAYFERVIDKREVCIGMELCLQVNGLPRYYILDVVPIYDSSKAINRVVGNLRDITDMKTTEEMLRNTEKLIFAGQLAVSIAHEVRNPLTTVKGMLQLSGKQLKPHFYTTMMSELDRMNLIVSEFMILGKPQNIIFKEEQCLAILQEVLTIFEFQATMNGITLECEFTQSLEIRCDRNQMKQMFLNILKNAMEALPYGGMIHVHLDAVDADQRIRITDNGEGMTEEVMSKIGEPFHTTKPEGNGLGMMIVQKIIATHQGRMKIASKRNEGTTVDIYLPCTIR
ncbi:hypothetical protein Back11_42800 [Paenibacillus baekrokdamisoli]|uniref:histidine kinase n=1 Tax=Paenibacillus baekrokdamisoli TaxID=1712516 RepID=A0A3G9J3K3_9BACL|nr:ATP-binding protein [Paenibacillus baekrokdamisoli]MBB3068017.1 signal transduction histidine kinase [Paenibacillus baekrokdamisoli]BBH22935.1 hypothetical protein Back11_42800 [Paenibacillus baekrokdamisoli]